MIGRRPDRVAASHDIAWAAFRLAFVSAGAAAVWALVVAVRGGSWWGPLHLLLAGDLGNGGAGSDGKPLLLQGFLDEGCVLQGEQLG